MATQKWEIGNIDNSPVGQDTPAPGAFTVLKASTDPTDEHGVGDRGFNDARYCLEANNLSDVGDAATAFDNIKQAASESATGVAELATDAESVTGTATDKVTTPANISARLAAPGEIGGTTPGAGNFTSVNASGLTASKLVASDGSKNLESVEPTVFETGGAQEIDGDKLDIDYTPTHYAPDTSPGEVDNADNLSAHLKGLDNALGVSYGVTWNESSDAYARTGLLAAVACGSSPGNALLPIQRLMRRCVVSDAGVVQYYLDPDDSTKKADGSTANLDGTDGQVMVEIPKFYVRYDYAANVHTWDISLSPLNGFFPHPAFYKNGAWVDYRYIGAYEGSMYDATAGAMVASGDIATDMYASGDKLCSISGQYPKTNETRAEFRAMAAERGTGWRQMDYYLLSAVQLLYLIEYADFDSQSMIGQGRTQLSGGTWAASSYIGIGGLSNGDGNGTNCVDYSGDGDDAGADAAYMTYRGIENWWGNVWEWVDGLNVRNYDPLGGSAYASYAYACNDDTAFADDTDTDYDEIADGGLAQADGYIATLVQTVNGFLPLTVGASSSTKLCDYYYTYFDDDPNSGWRVVSFGGPADSGAAAGAFCVNSYNASSSANVNLGGRLCF